VVLSFELGAFLVFAKEEWLPRTVSPRKMKRAGLKVIINKKK
jgi:hypothetical protein